MEEETKFYTIKDEYGIIRPRAGIWSYDKYGFESAKDFVLKKCNEDCEIIIVEINEIF